MLVLAFDTPSFRGEIVEELTRLREHDVIRLIDALAVQKDADGSLVALRWSDLSIEEAEGLGATIGALLGLGFAGEEGMQAGAIAGAEAGSDGHLIDDNELWDVADSIQPGNAAALVLIEHVWAIPLRDAIARAGGIPVDDSWIHPLDLIEAGLVAADELTPA